MLAALLAPRRVPNQAPDGRTVRRAECDDPPLRADNARRGPRCPQSERGAGSARQTPGALSMSPAAEGVRVPATITCRTSRAHSCHRLMPSTCRGSEGLPPVVVGVRNMPGPQRTSGPEARASGNPPR